MHEQLCLKKEHKMWCMCYKKTSLVTDDQNSSLYDNLSSPLLQ